MKAVFPLAYPRLMKIEGGNDDDPNDHGGRTSRGVTQHGDWDPYVKGHPAKHLPADVWRAPEEDVKIIYHDGSYWNGQMCDALHAGVDDTVFDYGVNSGVGRSGRVLRHVCGLPTTTWHVTQEVVDAANKRDPKALVKVINAERDQFLTNLNQPRFEGGWHRRVRELIAFDLHLVDVFTGKADAGTAPPITQPKADEPKGKATIPKPEHGKIITGGTAATGGLAGAVHWAGAHPFLTILLVAVGLVTVGWIIAKAQAMWEQKALHPVPGTPVVPEIGAKT